jgi:small subunit ribosomal protein S6e
MTDFKLVISDPKAKRAYQIEVKSPDADRFLGLKIGEKVRGETINLHGFEFQITGGSDKQGFPMRKDISGTRRIKAFIGHGVGLREAERGEYRRRSVRGNQISEDTAQINMILIKHGEKSLAAALGKEEKPKEGEVAKKEGSA